MTNDLLTMADSDRTDAGNEAQSVNPLLATQNLVDWHRPRLRRLRVSADTAAAPGSGADLDSGTNVC